VVDVPVGDTSGRTVVYVRVSSHDQQPDLEAQSGRVTTWSGRHALRMCWRSRCHHWSSCTGSASSEPAAIPISVPLAVQASPNTN
jgi:cell wall assembly regulator SMI1